MLEFRYDTQLLIEGENLNEDIINDSIVDNFKGDSLLVVGDDTLIKIHFHTNALCMFHNLTNNGFISGLRQH